MRGTVERMAKAAESGLPLSNVKVLDLSRWISGPLCSMLLADLGADVIKVERPGGEDVRTMEPLFHGESIFAMLYNRNKRSITLNTRTAAGKQILSRLVEWSDIVVENFRPGTMERMGFGYQRLQEINPRVILTSISGFGQTGPLRERPMFDAIAQAVSGMMSITGWPESPPTMSATFPADHTAGLFAALGTMAALRHRDHTGEGQVVDLAMLDSAVAMLGVALPVYLNVGTVMPRAGNRDSVTAPANTFRTADGYVHLDAGTDALWARLAAAMDQAALATDIRFKDTSSRLANVDELEDIVARWCLQYPASDIVAKLDSAGVPVGAVADMAQVAENPQLRARQMFESVAHPIAGQVTLPAIPIRLSQVALNVRLPPPSAGQHNSEILNTICGLTAEDIADLGEQGAI